MGAMVYRSPVFISGSIWENDHNDRLVIYDEEKTKGGDQGWYVLYKSGLAFWTNKTGLISYLSGFKLIRDY